MARDGEEGLRKVYQYHPDLIVSDLMMPKMDGMELLKRIRQDFNISHIPVIILTAKQGDEIHMQAISTGANAYITKPFSSDLLQARISQLLEEQRIFQRKMVLAPLNPPLGGGPNVKESLPQGEGSEGASPYESHLIQKDLEFVQNVHQIIEKNLQNDEFNVNTLAEEMGLSRSPFFKKLKSLTGFAPIDLVKEIRLTKALQYVETTDMNVTEIAYTVGFRDPGYFIKCFRQKYGKTPKEYRNDISRKP
jgi:YesN/AraC family two-component response regulator